MKQILLFICFISLGGLLNAQETKTMISYYDWYKTMVHEKYNVLVSNPSVKHGSYKRYGQNTVIIEEGRFNQGKMVGLWHFRNESDGFEYKTENYNQSGELDGEQTERSGKSKTVKMYSNGKPNGVQKSWNSDGILAKEYNFIDGLQQGKQMEYDETTGNPSVEAYFDKGKKVNIWKWYNSDGKLVQEKNYDKEGIAIIYDEKGGKSTVVLDGYNYKFDEWVYYNANGIIVAKGNYDNSQKISDWQIFDDNGALIKIEKYDYGKLVSSKSFEEIRKENEDYKNYLNEGDELSKSKDYSNALIPYQSALKLKPNEQYPKDKIKEVESALAQIEKKKADEKSALDSMTTLCNTKYTQFVSLYVGKKEIPFLVDESGKPIEKIDYLKGKNLYTKSDEIYQTMIKEYESMNDYQTKLKKGNDIILFLDKLISIANKDTKDIESRMKKVKSLEDAKGILME